MKNGQEKTLRKVQFIEDIKTESEKEDKNGLNNIIEQVLDKKLSANINIGNMINKLNDE